ncbi:MAG: GTP-binding protein [Promethearchaeota archaeon]
MATKTKTKTKNQRHIDKVLALMGDLTRIRNCSLIGHVDHGKTTLSDSLLASSGLLNPNLAGEAHLLDFLDEEQERGITMKSTNISLIFDHEGAGSVLMNLVDTPGHVDFSGKVTRALRLVDTAIVVVDAVEGIMIQTEHVVQQALENAVRPLLFINKIDRLIKELELDATGIQERFKSIISRFNDLLDAFGSPRARQEWKVDLRNGSVSFGSALNGWGATLAQFLDKYKTFQDIIDVYRGGEPGRRDAGELKKTLPVAKAIVAMVVKNGSNPRQAQQYRIPEIWPGDPDSDLCTSMKNCDASGPAVVFVSKVQVEQNQRIATGRVFSGSVKKGDQFILVKNATKDKVGAIGVFMGHRIIVTDEVSAGNVIAIKGIKAIKSGETLLATRYEGNARGNLAFDQISYLMEPVITVSVEPEKLVNLSKLQATITELTIEDPNLRMEVSEETGEILLSGIGPLHLEVVTNQIVKKGIPILVSKPITLFHESIEEKTGVRASTSTNGKNKISLQLEPLEGEQKKLLHSLHEDLSNTITKHAREAVRHTITCWSKEEVDNLLCITEDFNVISCPSMNNPQHPPLSDADKLLLVNAFKSVLRRGPLVQESIRDVKIVIEHVSLSSNHLEKSISEIIPMIRQAVHELMLQVGVTLLEPMFEGTVLGSVENIGKLTALISQYNGKVESMEQKGNTIKIRALFSVRKSFSLIEEAKSATSGRAVFQNTFHGLEKITGQEFDTIVGEIKIRKGLI